MNSLLLLDNQIYNNRMKYNEFPLVVLLDIFSWLVFLCVLENMVGSFLCGIILAFSVFLYCVMISTVPTDNSFHIFYENYKDAKNSRGIKYEKLLDRIKRKVNIEIDKSV